jgi:uncharacterized protein
MTVNPNLPGFYTRSPLSQLFISLLIIIVAGTILFILFILGGSLIFNIDPAALGNPSPVMGMKEIGFIKFSLAAQDISFFIIPGVFILTKMNPGFPASAFNIKNVGRNDALLVFILALCTFPLTGLAGQLNSGMVLPEWLSGVEQWMKEKEDSADRLLGLIMTPGSLLGMCLNIVIISALPAVGEELIFRGILQKIFHKLFSSGHLAVLLTSFLFSAIHLQFYGFLPRFILGMIFGYLFLFRRNIWFPVIAHFINNAVPTVGAFIKGWEAINSPPVVSPVRQIAGAALSLTIVIMILSWFSWKEAGSKKGDHCQLPT